jgi:acyl-ACP thioesterase
MPSLDQTQLLGRFPLIIEPANCDINGTAPLQDIVSHLLHASTDHAEENGFGFSFMETIQKAWVVSRMGIYIERAPVHDEHVMLYTWISNVDHYFTQRNFAILDKDGAYIVRAQAFWAAIDYKTRRPADLPTIQNGKITRMIVDRDPNFQVPKLSRIPSVDLPPVLTYSPKYGDIDINHHFNSAKLVEHALNLYSDELLSGTHVRQMEVVFLSEGTYGMNIHFCKSPDNVVDLKNAANNTSICRMRFVFDGKES